MFSVDLGFHSQSASFLVMTKPEGSSCKLPLKVPEEDREEEEEETRKVTVSLADVNETRVDTAVRADLSELAVLYDKNNKSERKVFQLVFKQHWIQ